MTPISADSYRIPDRSASVQPARAGTVQVVRESKVAVGVILLGGGS